MIKLSHIKAIIFLCITTQTFAQSTDLLRKKIQEIVATKNATVGVS
jgi:hypothetical protein